MSGISLRARLLASPVRNPFVFFENLPPTSTARTTSRARACTPTNSGYRRSLALLAASKATPSLSAAPLRGLPSPCNAHTQRRVAASCLPPNSGSPSTTTSNLRPLQHSPTAHPDLGQMRSSSRDLQLFCKCVLLRSPKRNPDGSAPLHADRQHDGGQKSRVDGHIGMPVRWGEAAVEVVAVREHKTGAKGLSFPCNLARDRLVI